MLSTINGAQGPRDLGKCTLLPSVYASVRILKRTGKLAWVGCRVIRFRIGRLRIPKQTLEGLIPMDRSECRAARSYRDSQLMAGR
jgi:hypothetical protein